MLPPCQWTRGSTRCFWGSERFELFLETFYCNCLLISGNISRYSTTETMIVLAPSLKPFEDSKPTGLNLSGYCRLSVFGTDWVDRSVSDGGPGQEYPVQWQLFLSRCKLVLEATPLRLSCHGQHHILPNSLMSCYTIVTTVMVIYGQALLILAFLSFWYWCMHSIVLVLSCSCCWLSSGFWCW